MKTDLQFLGFPVRLDESMPRYAIDLVNPHGDRIRIDLRYPAASSDGEQETNT